MILKHWMDIFTIIIGLIFSWKLYTQYTKTKSLQLLNFIPNVWTALGVLGTFISIYLAFDDINSESLSKNDAIVNIIRKITPAFSTSIIGLIGNVFSSTIIKWILSKEEKLEQDNFPTTETPEKMLYNINIGIMGLASKIEQTTLSSNHNHKELISAYNYQTGQIVETLSSQSEILKTFVDDFILNMNGLFADMRHSLGAQMYNFGEEQYQKTSELLENLNKMLSTQSTQLLEKQNNDLTQYYKDNYSKMEQMSDLLSSNFHNLTSKTLATFEDLIKKQELQMNQQAISNIQISQELNNKLKAEFDSITIRQVESLNQMVDLSVAYTEVTEKALQKSSEMNEQSITELKTQLSGFITSIQNSILEQTRELNSAISHNIESLKVNYEYVQDRLAHLVGNYEQATEAYHNAVQNAHNLNNSVEKSIDYINQGLSNSLSTNEQLLDLIHIVEDRQEKTHHLVLKIKEMSDAIDMLSQIETHLNKLVRQ